MKFRNLRWPLLLTAISINLQALAFDSVILWLKDGTKIIVPFSDKPEITFNGDQISVNNRIFNFSELSKYTIGGTSSIDLIGTDGKEINVDENGDIILCSALTPSDICVYGTDGIRYECDIVTLGNGHIKISLSALSPQIYIIKAGNHTFKMRKS